MSGETFPVLYSFRRCPYAMRARLALSACRQRVELREVLLRDKPAEMIKASPKATVPVLVLPDAQVIDESLDIMRWALSTNDEEGLRDFPLQALSLMDQCVHEADTSFKSALDRYKYPNRHEGIDPMVEREKGAVFIRKLEVMLADKPYLFGARFSFADAAVLPFVRQFAHVDRNWFWGSDWVQVLSWLDAFLDSERFKAIMGKHEQWEKGQTGIRFGG